MEDERYLRYIYMLHERCQQMQRENERFVARLHYIKKLSKRKLKDVALLKSRLDLYNDDWRAAQQTSNQRIIKRIKVTKPQGLPQNQSHARNFANGPANTAAPITKRKKSGSTKRQTQDLMWRPEYPLDDDWADVKEEEEEIQ